MSNHIQSVISRKLSAELHRVFWNKVKNIDSYTVEREAKKYVFKISFALQAPYSSTSSILIIIRENGQIDRWSKIQNDQPPKKETISSFSERSSALDEAEALAIVKQLLKEIL